MHCIVLAAGFGSRMGERGIRTPKALLPLKTGCVLDRVITSIWVEGITAVNVVHNNHHSRERGNWPQQFKRWKDTLQWIPDPGKQKKPPYIKLLNNGIHSEEGRAGAVGDLAAGIRRNARHDLPLLVVCSDDLIRDPHLELLKGVDNGKTSAITVQSVAELDPLLQDAGFSQVRVDGGRVEEIGPKVPDTPWRYCGPFYLAGKDRPFVLEYVDYMTKAGVLPDALDGLVDAMVSDNRVVRAVKVSTRFWSLSTEKLYLTAVQRMGVFMKQNEAAARRAAGMVRQVQAASGKDETVARAGMMRRAGNLGHPMPASGK